MSIQAPHTDADLLDLLRVAGPLRVSEMSEAMEVTPTAIRQRLVRLLSRGYIQREAIRTGRGRPRHNYWLTDKGLEQTGSNLTDLAMSLWREVRTVGDPDFRRDMLRRIANAMAVRYLDQVQGQTAAERMESLRNLLAQRRIPATVEAGDQRTTLTTHACPYPNLAEDDRGVCTMERMMFSQLVGKDVSLTRCRLDEGGTGECQFQVR